MRGTVRALGCTAVCLVVAGLAVLGMVSLQPAGTSMLVITVPTGAFVGFEVLVARSRAAVRPGPWSALLVGAVTAAVATFAVLGLGELVGPVGAATLAIGAVGVIVYRYHRRSRLPVVPRPVPSLRPLPPHTLDDLGTADLCRMWRASFTPVEAARSDPERLAELAEQRRRCLDELARRDPAGFARWMASGARAASDPSRYLTPGSAAAPPGRTGPDETPESR